MNYHANRVKGGIYGVMVGITALTTSIASANDLQIPPYQVSFPDQSLDQVTRVTQFKDVSPYNWSFEALTQLVEKYGCIEGYPDQTYRGDRALTRYEFAAGLNSCLEALENRLQETTLSVETSPTVAPESIGISTNDMIKRAFYNDTGRFFDITNLSGQANLIFGWRFWENSFFDRMIANDAEFVGTIYQDVMNQQTAHPPIRTRDLPNPYETSVFENPSYTRPMIPSSGQEVRF